MPQSDLNPYASPLAHSSAQPASGREWFALAGAILSLIVPGILACEQFVSLAWIFGNVQRNIVVTLVVYVLTLCSVPLGYLGLKSRWSTLAVLALVSGSLISVWMFKIKFYPWLRI